MRTNGQNWIELNKGENHGKTWIFDHLYLCLSNKRYIFEIPKTLPRLWCKNSGEICTLENDIFAIFDPFLWSIFQELTFEKCTKTVQNTWFLVIYGSNDSAFSATELAVGKCAHLAALCCSSHLFDTNLVLILDWSQCWPNGLKSFKSCQIYSNSLEFFIFMSKIGLVWQRNANPEM